MGRWITAALLSLSAAAAAIIQGSVVDNKTGRPVARARVSIESVNGASFGGPGTVLSDSNGRFSFTGLPAGGYLLRATRSGFAETRYGQRAFKGAGTPIVVETQSVYVAPIRIFRLGAISGEVVDENGLGLAGIAVYAYRSGSPLKLSGAGQTDDRGAYRIAGLEPGRYLVRTAPRELEDREGLLPTFFAQSAQAQTARVVEVRLEQEVANVTIEPLHGRLSRVVGQLSEAVDAEVVLHLDTGKREQRIPAGGQFLFDQLAPGEYELFVQAGDRAGYRKLAVSKEVENISVDLGPVPQVRLTCEERTGNRFDPRRIPIFARRKDTAVEASTQRLACGQPAALGPGLWELAAAAPPDLYVQEIRGSGDGMTSSQTFELRLMPGQVRDLTIVVSTKPARLEGTVTLSDGTPAIGTPVYLVAVDSDVAVLAGGIRSARTDQNGAYRFLGLPPGRYEVVSCFEADWEALSAGRRTTVQLTEGSEESLRIRLLEGE
jgi:protocatechuate 3,4-dioxygenase beta subunit